MMRPEVIAGHLYDSAQYGSFSHRVSTTLILWKLEDKGGRYPDKSIRRRGILDSMVGTCSARHSSCSAIHFRIQYAAREAVAPKWSWSKALARMRARTPRNSANDRFLSEAVLVVDYSGDFYGHTFTALFEQVRRNDLLIDSRSLRLPCVTEPLEIAKRVY